jgi:maltooligosyltrehalose synthase
MRRSAGATSAYGSGEWLDAWAGAWKETQAHLPDGSPSRLRNIFTGEWLQAESGSLNCSGLFRHFPVALLSPD